MGVYQPVIWQKLCWKWENLDQANENGWVIGSFSKMEQVFSGISEFKESHKSWIGVNLKILSFKSCWCCVSILVSNQRGSRFEPCYCNDKYFCDQFHWIQWKHLGKTQLFSSPMSCYALVQLHTVWNTKPLSCQQSGTNIPKYYN